MTPQTKSASQGTTDAAQIEQVLQRFSAGWRTGDVALLKSLWDHEHQGNSYIASERERAVLGPAAVDQYYDETLAAFSITSMEISNIHVDLLDDVAHAFCDIAIGWQWKGQDLLSHPRATFVLRKRGETWYVIHYHESIQWQLPQ